jgi:hypothetical protein
VFDFENGVLETTGLSDKAAPVANILGGFSLSWDRAAGGCASGSYTLIGEDSCPRLSQPGFFFGAVMTATGCSACEHIPEEFPVEINGNDEPGAMGPFRGGPALKWLTIAIFAVGVLAFSRASPN